ncbi:hypothetical protein [Nesterenkonia sp.]|uniref:hypothetical protein n=1 Tax=Nesterenkonia sp. TaxID=704201 RepID=UPI002638E4D3|nr:hypothetical protein [Nesterenkonia sp.]
MERPIQVQRALQRCLKLLTPAVLWDIGLTPQDPDDESSIHVGLRAAGDWPLKVAVGSCSQPWEDSPAQGSLTSGSCTGAFQTVVAEKEAAGGYDVDWLAELPAAEQQWLCVEISMPGDLKTPTRPGEMVPEVHALVEGEHIVLDPHSPQTSSAASAGKDPSAQGARTVVAAWVDWLPVQQISQLWMLLCGVAGVLAGGSALIWAARRWGS